jgi:hypothetical protein
MTIDIFYYFGIIYILQCVYNLFRKPTEKEKNEVLEVDLTAPPTENFKKYKEYAGWNLFISTLDLIWMILGCFITNEKPIFAVLVIVVTVIPFISSSDKLAKLNRIHIITQLVLIIAILLHHFPLTIILK